jgi:sugar phosphate isomerase/epimerase
MQYPKIYLSIDNCFASKRWTRPEDWLRVIADAGIHYVEASADNECDPLYMDDAYLRSWTTDIRKYAPEYGIKIANLYSGHGTYTTLGLAHTDRRNADKMLFGWLGRMLDIAWELDCGLGFFCHAFDQMTLQSPELYYKTLNDLTERLASLAARATKLGLPKLGVEQMYTPHQVPWTITGARELLREVKRRSGNNFYLTIDTGHQSGQRKFLRPNRENLKQAVSDFKRTGRFDGVWFGPEKIYSLIRAAAPVVELEAALADYPYLFAEERDGDTYEWLGQLAPYSPVIHLQQTDGKKSAHLPFNASCNASGIICGEKVLNAIAAAYEKTPDESMPDRCEAIYLTLEIFGGTADLPVDIEYKVKDSAAYWRKFIPEDGLSLDKLREKL